MSIFKKIGKGLKKIGKGISKAVKKALPVVALGASLIPGVGGIAGAVLRGTSGIRGVLGKAERAIGGIKSAVQPGGVVLPGELAMATGDAEADRFVGLALGEALDRKGAERIKVPALRAKALGEVEVREKEAAKKKSRMLMYGGLALAAVFVVPKLMKGR